MADFTNRLNLAVTPESTNKSFKSWRLEMDNDTDSNMTKIDDAFEELFSRSDAYGPAELVSFYNGDANIPLKKCLVHLKPIQAGSGDPSPTNIRAISTRTGATVTRAGKNLFDIGAVEPNSVITNNGDGTITVRNASESSDAYPASTLGPLRRYAHALEAGKTYTLSGASTAPSTNQAIYLRGADVLWRFGESKLITEAILDSLVYFYAGVAGGTAVISELQMEEGSAPTAYEPYCGSEYTFDWETEAGAIYGGTLDMMSGTLKPNSAIVRLGALPWGQFEGNEGDLIFYAELPSDLKPQKTAEERYRGLTCDRYSPDSEHVYVRDVADKKMLLSGVRIYIHDSSYSDVTSFKASVDGAYLVYPTKSSLTYQLTPQHVTALTGANYIWTDAGDVTVEYGAFLASLGSEIRVLCQKQDELMALYEALAELNG